MSDSPLITEIELSLFEIQVPNVGTDPAGLGISYVPGPGLPQTRLAVRIHTDEGVTGEYVPPRGRAKVVFAACEALAHGLIGRPALARESNYQAMRQRTRHIGEVGIGPLDIALWDIAGKRTGLSITRLLGGDRKRLPTYASTLHGDAERDGLSSNDAYVEFAEQCRELGYPAYKMHGWSHGDRAQESAMIEAVAAAVGDRMTIMYDSSCHLATLADAIHVGHACDANGLYWFEDPYADGGISIQGHRKLKEHVRTPILIGEFVRNPEAMTDLLVSGASDFARVDPDYDGGLTGCYRAALAAESLGHDVEVHACGPAMRHLMAALRSSNYYEMNLLHPRMTNAWSLPVYACDYRDEIDAIGDDGCVPVPDGPGLGVAYDWPAIEGNLVDTRTIR